MKLTQVDILNYRSIRNISVSFDPACRVLVGINESGKSNILRALSHLDDDVLPSRNDVREPLPDEAEIAESIVEFHLRLEREDINSLTVSALKQILIRSPSTSMATIGGKKANLHDLCNLFNDVRYYSNLLDEEKYALYIEPSENIALGGLWIKPNDHCPPDFQIQRDGKAIRLADCAVLSAAEWPNLSSDYTTKATYQDVLDAIGALAVDLVSTRKIKSILWEYDERKLLPSQVHLDSFANNPASCEPLRNMFSLAGVRDIAEELSALKNRSPNQSQNFFNRIARKTTTHFRSIWKEYGDIEFVLKVNADHVVPGIKEKNSFDLAKRSDGFKRFVTFLLLISANVKTDNLTNTLLLIDEPDFGLHPSGARYLRDELIRISSKNYVAYSTHSIFMIDPGNLARHYIVKKKNETTTVDTAKASNIADEEVLFNALGHSMFAVLKQKNMIFEGWKDKRLFHVGLGKAKASLKKRFQNVGVCHARGAKHIKTVTPMIELAKRTCLIVSDSDAPAREQQKLFRTGDGYGDWRIYQEIVPGLTAVTGEDFIRKGVIAKQVEAAIKGLDLPKFDVTALPNSNRLASLSAWLRGNGLTADQSKDVVDRVKDALFDALATKDIEADYFVFLEGLANAIEAQQPN